MNFGDETVSARDDYDELESLERGAGVTCIEDAETQAKVALNEIDRLRAAAKHGELMARAVIELVDEKAALEAEIQRLREQVEDLTEDLAVDDLYRPDWQLGQPS